MATGDGMIGKVVGDYHIEKQLGEGGMGVVFKGVHPALGQIVAIKMLHPNLVKADSIKQRFVREAQAMARLRHPNILQLFNFVENADGCFIIMEYVEGKTFESILEESGVIPPERALELFMPILDAMQYAHDAGIIHRDIKPSNFMLLNTGMAKVMDFGTAKVAGGSQLTAAGMTLGTVVYMSPEQLMGRDLNPSADVYSLGVTLYEMCTGRLPFYHDNEMMLMKMIMKEAPPAPSSIYPAMPKSLEKAILKAMDKTAAKRYQSCKEFKVDCEKVKAELGGGGKAAPAAPPPPPPAAAAAAPPKTPTPATVPSQPDETQSIQRPHGMPPAATTAGTAVAPAGKSPLVFVGGGVAGVGVLAGVGLMAGGMGLVGGIVLGSLLVVGSILLVVGLTSKPGGAAPAGMAGLSADQKRTCPTCQRVLLPTMATCPFCAPAVKQDAGDTGQAVPTAMAAQAAGAAPPPGAGSAPPGQAFLDILDGSMQGQRVSLSQQPTTLGRAPDNMICMKDPSVSSHHARIDFYQGKYFLSDLQSSNGTYVNNTRIEQTQLNNQDMIAFGSTRVVIHCG